MSVNEASPMVVMGKIVAAQGIQGWVKVQTFTEYLDSLLDYDTWYVGNEQAWRPLEVLEANVHGKVLVAKLEGIADRTAAEKVQRPVDRGSARGVAGAGRRRILLVRLDRPVGGESGGREVRHGGFACWRPVRTTCWWSRANAARH